GWRNLELHIRQRRLSYESVADLQTNHRGSRSTDAATRRPAKFLTSKQCFAPYWRMLKWSRQRISGIAATSVVSAPCKPNHSGRHSSRIPVVQVETGGFDRLEVD